MPKSNPRNISFDDIIKMRQVAEDLKADFPYLPLVLELVISGLGRAAISSLKLESIDQNGIINWQNRNHVKLKTKMTNTQITILDEYLKWRLKRQVDHDYLIMAKKGNRYNRKRVYFFPIKETRVRSDMHFLGKEIGIKFKVELPVIHRAVLKELLKNDSINKKIIYRHYRINEND